MLKRLGYWLFCKLGDPIFSASQAIFFGKRVCLWCGKCHGTLLKYENE